MGPMIAVQIVVAILAIAFITFTLATQIAIQSRARAIRGKPVPPLPGDLGARVAKSPHALIYFFSEGCAACRPFTPRLRALGEERSVFVIDVLSDLGVARAFGVLATPSTVEIEDGKVVALHVGRVPEDVIGRFA